MILSYLTTYELSEFKMFIIWLITKFIRSFEYLSKRGYYSSSSRSSEPLMGNVKYQILKATALHINIKKSRL